ncbi:hypothetical protein [Prevotella sp. 10(H)]|uniref:hypothetical protein n=1 Tax=Prevotella sp. 10(H) TaxID=1158294 RepID=UPI00056351EA|nr:hypothetical protein [Prevotella sp. 10(H)]
MAKFNNKLATRIIEMIEQDLFGISEICKILHIAPKTFYEWRKTKPEFNEAVEAAIDHREESLVASARMGLKQLLEGYIQKEEKITYIPDKNNPAEDIEKNRIIKKKHCAPSIRAIRYVLERNDKMKEKKAEQPSQQRPLIIEVPDEETKRQLMIFRKNDFHTGGAENAKIVVAVDEELEREREKKAQTKRIESKKQKISEILPSSIDCCLPPGYTRRG